MRASAAVLLIMLLAGCTGAGPPPGDATPSPPAPDAPSEGARDWQTISVDGRWAFPLEPARAIATGAGYPPSLLGAYVMGEASFGPAAAPILAGDARAAQAFRMPPPPARGTVVLSPALADALGARVGDRVEARAAAWPAPRVLAAFEMESARPCSPESSVSMCILAPGPDNATRLRVRVPPGSSDLRFHPDVVELGPDDFPAFWNGTLESPGGTRTGFSTSALERGATQPPGAVTGPLEAGDWTVTFTVDANHRRMPTARVGYLTLRAPGFAPFDFELRSLDAPGQTRSVLANATLVTAPLRVAGVEPLPHAGAWLALDDARDLLGLGAGNVTGLVAPGASPSFEERAGASEEPALSKLKVRALPSAPAPAPRPGALVLWAPPSLDVSLLPRVEGAGVASLTFESSAPMGVSRVNERPGLEVRILALSEPPPWRLHPGGLWAAPEAAFAGIAATPHLVLLGDDLVDAAGGAPTNATYLKLEVETGLGPRVLFGMGAVEGGPARSAWASAALVAASGAAKGARLVVEVEDGADRAELESRLIERWAPWGVARLLDA